MVIRMKRKNSIIRSALHVGGVIAIATLIALRQWYLYDKQYLVSEDGAIFISRACEGRIRALLTPYAGYYHFLIQAITDGIYTICLRWNNIEKMPHLMWISSIIVSAVIASYFTSERFSWLLSEKLYRFYVCCLIVLLHICEFPDLYGTMTNLQWWFSFYFFLLALQMFHSRQLPKKFEMIVLMALGFSTAGILPLFLCITVMVAYRFVKGIAIRSDIYKWIMIACPTAIQTFSVLASGRMNTDLALAEKMKHILPAYLVLMGKTVIPQSFVFYSGRFIIIGIGVMVFILYQMKDEIRTALFSLGYAFFIYAFHIFPIQGDRNNAAILAGDFRQVGGNVGSRYWFVTFSIFAFLVALSLAFGLQKGCHHKSMALIMLMIVTITATSRFEMENYLVRMGDYSRYYAEYSPLFSKDGTRKLRIPLHDPYWAAMIPSPDYNALCEWKEELFRIDTIDGIEYSKGMSIPSGSNYIKIGGCIENKECQTAYAMFLVDGVYYPLYTDNGNSVSKAQKKNGELLYVWLPSGVLGDGEHKLELIALEEDKKHGVRTLVDIDCSMAAN